MIRPLTLGCLLMISSLEGILVGATSRVVEFHGMCDASAAIRLDDHHFVVANDEDNLLRIYHLDQPGSPVSSHAINDHVGVAPSHPETDLEGAARLGDTLFWISSHGGNKEGKSRINRRQFFGMKVTANPTGAPSLTPVGHSYHQLIDDLVADPRYQRFGLRSASLKAPKQLGGLNIEGLAAAPNQGLFIGFRNPVDSKGALIAWLENPQELIETRAKARFNEPIQLDLAGLGIRDLFEDRGKYWVIGGSYDGEKNSRLFTWDGPGTPAKEVDSVDFQPFNPESILWLPKTNQLLVLSDDGTRKIGGEDCKSLTDPSRKKFRAQFLPLPLATP